MLNSRQDNLYSKLYFINAALASLAWIVIAWIGAHSYVNWQADQSFVTVEKKGREAIAELQEGLDRTFGILHSVPTIISRDKDVRKALLQANSMPSYSTQEERRRFFEKDPQLIPINQSLSAFAHDIGVISIIWVMKPNGIAIAASNANAVESFVGTDYSDREYFKAAMSGRNGNQYAMGRQTNIPGLFFSSPVYDQGNIIGVVAGKIDLSYLSNWVNQSNGFLIDQYGVIIQAKDPQFEMMILPDADVHKLTENERFNRYKRKEFSYLQITSWKTDFNIPLMRIGNLESPFYILSSEFLNEKLRLMVAIEAPYFGSKDADRTLLFLVLSATGILCIILITTLIYHFKALQIAKRNRSRQELIEHLASHDSLTGLYSRSLTDPLITQGISIASRSNKQLAIMLIDLDLFKDINDSFGHEIGDNALKELSLRIKSSIRDSDTVIRQGGDEFIVLLNGIPNPHAAAATAIKIQEAIQHPYVIQDTTLNLSASIGISMYPSDGDTASLLLRHADTALYNAKGKGRADYSFYQTQMSVDLAARKTLESEMVKGLENREFYLVYQPQYSLEKECINGCEALVRWAHPTKGVVSPFEFIPAAERSGFIVPLGEWILNEACRQASIWRQELKTDIPVAVNLSTIQFQRTNLLDTVTQAIERNKIPPHILELELTESLMMADTEHTFEIMKELKALGINISIDDFGTGYSSLAYLKKFDADVLKIDRAFVYNMENDVNDQAIVSAVINMAQSLDYKVIAEGVETESQFELLRKLECHSIQGYWFSKPLSVADFTKFFTENHHRKI